MNVNPSKSGKLTCLHHYYYTSGVKGFSSPFWAKSLVVTPTVRPNVLTSPSVGRSWVLHYDNMASFRKSCQWLRLNRGFRRLAAPGVDWIRSDNNRIQVIHYFLTSFSDHTAGDLFCCSHPRWGRSDNNVWCAAAFVVRHKWRTGISQDGCGIF